MRRDESKYDRLTGQRKISYGQGAGIGAGAGTLAGAALSGKGWKKGLTGAAIGAGAGALYGLTKIKGRNDSNKKVKRFAAAGYMAGKKVERARLIKALETARDKAAASKPKKIEKTASASEKTASDYLRAKQSKSKRFTKQMSRRKYFNKGFGGSTRRKKI